MNLVREYVNQVLDIIYPNHCIHCDSVLLKEEKDICTTCIGILPYSNFISYQNNPVYNVFKGRIPVEYAFSLLVFEPNSITQDLIHALKYKGRKSVGVMLGVLAAQEFEINKSKEEYPELITCVPLHPDKLILRGYNQAGVIAKAFADYLKIQFSGDLITKSGWNESQTNKNRTERWSNVEGIYQCVDKEIILNKHILMFDDVITTGATMESCVSALLEVNCGVKISVAGIAYTQ